MSLIAMPTRFVASFIDLKEVVVPIITVAKQNAFKLAAALAYHLNQCSEVGADRCHHDLNVGEDIHSRIAVEPMLLKYQVFGG